MRCDTINMTHNCGFQACNWKTSLRMLESCTVNKLITWELSIQFSIVQSLSCVWLFATTWTAVLQASYPSPIPGACSNSCPLSQWGHPTISSSVVPFSSCLQSCPALESFQWVDTSQQVAKVLELQPQHQSFQWIFGLISFRMDWLDLLAVQGTLKSLLQHHSLKASILWCSAFFMVQLSHPYI